MLEKPCRKAIAKVEHRGDDDKPKCHRIVVLGKCHDKGQHTSNKVTKRKHIGQRKQPYLHLSIVQCIVALGTKLALKSAKYFAKIQK